MKKILVLSLFISTPVWADLDKASTEALDKTKHLLVNPQEREKALQADPKGREADQKLKALVGSEKSEDVYKMASEIFDRLTKEAGGDPQKMQKLLEEAQKNPQSFYHKMLTDAERAKVRGLATDVEKGKTQGSSPR